MTNFMRGSITPGAAAAMVIPHNSTAEAGVKSRLPLARLQQVGAMNTRAGRVRYEDGFGDMAPPDIRPRAAVISFSRRAAQKEVERAR
jgi:hypothetical protein